MPKIRLARVGRTHDPHYHIVVMDSRKSRNGEFIEKLGYYNPFSKELKLNIEDINRWTGFGAQMTDRVKFLVKKNLLKS